MYLVIDNAYSGSFEDKVRYVFTEEDEVEYFGKSNPDYRSRSLEIYVIDGNNGTVNRVRPWWIQS